MDHSASRRQEVVDFVVVVADRPVTAGQHGQEEGPALDVPTEFSTHFECC